MMSLAPKKDGGPNTKFFESPETVSLFDAIKSWLQKNCKKVRLSSQAICRALLCNRLVCIYDIYVF
jgi:SWI/SNF related-matrix-associated actin-dependent regulator of chromatin subfamily C